MDRPIPVDGYIVERKKLTGFTWVRCHESHVPVPELTVSNLSEEADYQFRVSAVNAYGQSPYLEFPGSLHLGEHETGTKWGDWTCGCFKNVSYDFEDSEMAQQILFPFTAGSPASCQPLTFTKAMKEEVQNHQSDGGWVSVVELWVFLCSNVPHRAVGEAELPAMDPKPVNVSSAPAMKRKMEMAL